MNHYIHCPHLLAFQSFLFENIAVDPLIRFGIKHPQTHNLLVLSCLFSAYHALKGEVRSGKINVHASGWIKVAWSVFANALKAEAGEMQLITRAFSLPKFIGFLVQHRVPSLAAVTGGFRQLDPRLSQSSLIQHRVPSLAAVCDSPCGALRNSCTNSCTNH